MGARVSSLLGWALWLVLSTPGLAAACSVCMSGREDENRLAFILTTAFLTLLPLALIGGVVMFLRSRLRELAEREENARKAEIMTAWRPGATPSA
ncbi:MAG: hypothetical protein ACQGVK_06000 [Myxococcota bacterium]